MIDGISGIGAVEAARVPRITSPAVPLGVGEADGAGDAPSFGDQIGSALSTLNGMHNTADALGVQAATGDLDDVHEYTIAATQAEIATQLTVAVRDRAVNAFNEIMRMPI